MILRAMLRAALVLAGFSAAGVALVALTQAGTRERIAEVERQVLLRNLHAVVSPDLHDNDPTRDVMEVLDPVRLGTDLPVTVYRARREGRPVAAILTPVAPDGYSGRIRLMVAVKHDGTLAGVRVLAHQETPGLGDYIEERRSDWITRFAGRSLTSPPPERWKVKRDGGDFDQFTGATITPRAVVKAVRNTLELFQARRDVLFTPPVVMQAAE
jgi:electron transport complex protein RnfG